MIEVDLHSHSLFSTCGVHTVIEMLTAAKAKGVKGLAITDHGKLVGGRSSTVFFERLKNPIPGIELIKGIEANLDGNGGTDVPPLLLPFMDIILLGIHDNIPRNQNIDFYTSLLIKTLENNPYIDIVTHPNNSANFPINYTELCKAAVSLNVVLEMNNSKVCYGRNDNKDTMNYIRACIDTGCRVVISSDAHCTNEIGEDSHIRELLVKADFPENQIINSSFETAFEFIKSRRKTKR